MSQSRSEETFSGTGTAGDNKILSAADKTSIRQPMDLIFIHASMFAVINVFDNGLISELGVLHASLYASVVTVIPFMIDKECRQFIGCIVFCLSFFNAGGEGTMHAQQTHAFHFV